VSRADPFIIYYNWKYYLFFEEFKLTEWKWYLCVWELYIPQNILKNVRIILKKDYHLSFPFVFKYKKNFYLIPETSENNEIALYKFTNFPYELKKIKTLLKGKYVDSILIKFNNKRFLLTSKLKEKYKHNLLIFFSEDFLKKPFLPHPKNPIITNQEFSRNWWNIIKKYDKLYRISQDNSIFYWSKINILEILILNEKHYKEKYIKSIKPPSWFLAFHTYNISNWIEVADWKVIVSSFFLSLKLIFRKIFKILKIIK